MNPVLLLLLLVHLSQPSLILNNTHLHRPRIHNISLPPVLLIPPSTTTHDEWPPVPYRRYIRNTLYINITGYGDLLSSKHTPNVLQALLPIQRTIKNLGRPRDILEETFSIGETKGDVYTEVGFYSLHPPKGGIARGQANEVLNTILQLTIEFFPAREITLSTVEDDGQDLALFRLSFRVI